MGKKRWHFENRILYLRVEKIEIEVSLRNILPLLRYFFWYNWKGTFSFLLRKSYIWAPAFSAITIAMVITETAKPEVIVTPARVTKTQPSPNPNEIKRYLSSLVSQTYNLPLDEVDLQKISDFKKLTDQYYRNLYEREQEEDRIPDLLPIKDSRIISRFGPRGAVPLPGGGILEGPSFHQGIDLFALMGTPVRAAGAGVIIHADYDEGWGNNIIIVHSEINGKTLSTRYAHLSKIPPSIYLGKWVEKGEIIALSGSTGNSSGPHVHCEWYEDGIPVDPEKYLKK